MYSETEARKLVIEAGTRLVASGLVARTWGNISARISSSEFIITPSGRAYDTLTPADLVKVKVADCSYEGDLKPSSEKGIHADIYKIRPEASFVIHTHQNKASAVSIGKEDLKTYGSLLATILGELVPCASYAISSTPMLRKKVAKSVRENPSSKAFLMTSHGALCIGKDFEEAFALSSELENVARQAIETKVMSEGVISIYSEKAMRKLYISKKSGTSRYPSQIPDYGSSCRKDDSFFLELGGNTLEYNLSALPDDISEAAMIHAEIYKKNPVSVIKHVTDPDIVAISVPGHTLVPCLDDLAQIAGTRIKTGSGLDLAKKLHGKNAVLIKECGAFCTGNSTEEANDVELVLEKAAAAEIYSAFINHPHKLGFFDAFIQRTFYVMKYSKLKNGSEKKHA